MSDQKLLDKFAELCKNHDLFYSYSDDGRVYRRGEAEYSEIVKLSKQIDRSDAVRIWNDNVMENYGGNKSLMWGE